MFTHNRPCSLFNIASWMLPFGLMVTSPQIWPHLVDTIKRLSYYWEFPLHQILNISNIPLWGKWCNERAPTGLTAGQFYREVCGDYATNLLTNEPHGTGRKALGAETFFPSSSWRKCSGLYAAIDGSFIWLCCLVIETVILKDAKEEKVYIEVWQNDGIMERKWGHATASLHSILLFTFTSGKHRFFFFFFTLEAKWCS